MEIIIFIEYTSKHFLTNNLVMLTLIEKIINSLANQENLMKNYGMCENTYVIVIKVHQQHVIFLGTNITITFQNYGKSNHFIAKLGQK